MKCAHCPAGTRVLETREREEFWITRRHLCTNGHRFSTIQLLFTTVHTQRLWLTSAHSRAMAGVHQRRGRYVVRAAVRAMLERREKHAVIALTLGCSEKLVGKVAREMRNAPLRSDDD